MSTATKIEWTRGDDGAAGATWNPVTGCVKVSEGCDNCYAATFAERWRGVPGHPFEQGFDLRLWPERLALPLTWRKARRVFVNSMSDLFIGRDQVPDSFIAAVWATMFWTSPEGQRVSAAGKAGKAVHTYQVLTKRPARMRAFLARWGDADQRVLMLAEAADRGWADQDDVLNAPWMPAVLSNVWVGTSVETDRWARVRMPELARVPAVVRFVSAEPLLGETDLRPWLGVGLDWLIVGGESGPGARPMEEEWARDLVRQSQEAGVPVFVKQMGSVWGRRHGIRGKATDPATWPADLGVREFPAAGRRAAVPA